MCERAPFPSQSFGSPFLFTILLLFCFGLPALEVISVNLKKKLLLFQFSSDLLSKHDFLSHRKFSDLQLHRYIRIHSQH